MEFNVLEETKTRLVAEVEGEDATLMNLVRKELWNDKDVKTAAYSKKHPSVSAPTLIVETSGKEPRKALADAVARIKKDLAGVEKAAAKAV
ncbi:DNA-directed RNA polymerase subunit L [Candidatus Woesearchaeota archaeon]|nr:DNA-directed RNA polymerase subunit L [Candidatus Woesearchaeota archaeon]